MRAQPSVAEPVHVNRGIYLPGDARGPGDGRYVYLTSRTGTDGAVFATTLTLGAGIGSRLMLGATVAFHAMPRATGQSGSGGEWGPYFGPSGYLGPTLGVLGERVSFDYARLRRRRKPRRGRHRAHRRAVALSVELASNERLSVGLRLSPDLRMLRERSGEQRPVVYAGFTLGVPPSSFIESRHFGRHVVGTLFYFDARLVRLRVSVARRGESFGLTVPVRDAGRRRSGRFHGPQSLPR